MDRQARDDFDRANPVLTCNWQGRTTLPSGLEGYPQLVPESAARAAKSPLPDDSTARKAIPIWEGVIAYAPAAIAAAARISVIGNRKHNPGEELHHARGKSMDHTDCIARHLIDFQAIKAAAARAGSWAASDNRDTAAEHLGNLVWRALMFAQEQLEEMGLAPLAPRARLPKTEEK